MSNTLAMAIVPRLFRADLREEDDIVAGIATTNSILNGNSQPGFMFDDQIYGPQWALNDRGWMREKVNRLDDSLKPMFREWLARRDARKQKSSRIMAFLKRLEAEFQMNYPATVRVLPHFLIEYLDTVEFRTTTDVYPDEQVEQFRQRNATYLEDTRSKALLNQLAQYE